MSGFKQLPDKITIGDKYGPAMEIIEQADADAYFAMLTEHTIRHGADAIEAERVEKANLGYFAGYYSSETRERVERLFRCAHPIFGSIAANGLPTADAALVSGVTAAIGLRK